MNNPYMCHWELPLVPQSLRIYNRCLWEFLSVREKNTEMDWKAVLMVHLGSSLYSLQIRSTSYKILSILCPQTVPNVILSNDFCVFLRMLTRLSKIVFKTTRMASKQPLNVIMTPNIPIRVLCLFLTDQKWISRPKKHTNRGMGQVHWTL